MEISDIDKESTIGYNKQEKYKKRHKAAKKRRYKGDRKDMQNAESRMAVHTHTHTHTHTGVLEKINRLSPMMNIKLFSNMLFLSMLKTYKK